MCSAQRYVDTGLSGLRDSPCLSFDRVGKTFHDGTTALADVTFELAPGEFVTVVGPSGCGKSTLLKLASGLLTPSAGSVVAPPSETIGYIFQDPALLPWRTVRANVELLGEFHGIPRHERRQRATAAIELVRLSGFARHYPLQLSVGMRMRVSIARSLTLQPVMFLFDEPFGALDEITRERLNDELMRLHVEQGFAGLFVTHSVLEAAFLGSRVLVVSSRPGRVTEQITVPFEFPRPPELRYDPVFMTTVGRIKDALRRAST